MRHRLHVDGECLAPDALDLMKVRALLEAAVWNQDINNGIVVPCMYLGAYKGRYKKHDPEQVAPRSEFEMDPAKFLNHSMHGTTVIHVEIWYEWEYVWRSREGRLYPHRVCIQASDIILGKRKVPLNPLGRQAPSNLYFDDLFMQKVAALKDQGIMYLGNVYCGSKVGFWPALPEDGKDVQDKPMYWTLPGGKLVCYSVRKLIWLNQTELQETPDERTYSAIADVLGLCFLGMIDRSVVEKFMLSPGTLRSKEFLELSKRFGKNPIDAFSFCWWAVVTGDLDGPPRLIRRTLKSLLLDLAEDFRVTYADMRRIQYDP